MMLACSRITVCGLILLFLSALQYAQAATISSVSGNGCDGNSIIITGSGFGTHSVVTQWLGGSDGLIETSPVGVPPPNVNNWTFDSFGDNYITTDSVHSGNHAFRNDLIRNIVYAAAIRYGWSSQIGYSQDTFISWWVRRVHVGEGQWKMFRVSYANDITDIATPQFKMFNWDNGTQFFVVAGPTTNATGASWSMPYPTQDNRWYRMDVEVHTSSGHATSDGNYLVRLYDPESETVFRQNTVMNTMSFNDDNDYYQWFLWQNYMGNDIDGNLMLSQSTWTDDIYIQVGEKSRLELCDKPVWADRTHCEIQVPTEWSDSSIEFTFNRGSFNGGLTAYIFVIDNDGNVSNGYPVTVGETTAPHPPSTLHVDKIGDGAKITR